MTSRRRLSMLLVLLLVLAVPQAAFGNASGKTGASSNGCGCHGGGANQVTPSLGGLPADGYEPTTSYALSIGGSGTPSGTQGGFNLASTLGTFSNPGTNAQLSAGEVTHSNSNARAWTVNWTSPTNDSGDVTFTLAVNFVNGNGFNTGDGWGTDSWVLSQEPWDSDGDGWSDDDESACGTDSQDNSSVPTDTDGDGVCNPIDTDDDDDGWSDTDESACGTDSEDSNSTPIDTDSDGTCNALDSDDDGDGWSDTEEDD